MCSLPAEPPGWRTPASRFGVLYAINNRRYVSDIWFMFCPAFRFFLPGVDSAQVLKKYPIWDKMIEILFSRGGAAYENSQATSEGHRNQKEGDGPDHARRNRFPNRRGDEFRYGPPLSSKRSGTYFPICQIVTRKIPLQAPKKMLPLQRFPPQIPAPVRHLTRRTPTIPLFQRSFTWVGVGISWR